MAEDCWVGGLDSPSGLRVLGTANRPRDAGAGSGRSDPSGKTEGHVRFLELCFRVAVGIWLMCLKGPKAIAVK